MLILVIRAYYGGSLGKEWLIKSPQPANFFKAENVFIVHKVRDFKIYRKTRNPNAVSASSSQNGTKDGTSSGLELMYTMVGQKDVEGMFHDEILSLNHWNVSLNDAFMSWDQPADQTRVHDLAKSLFGSLKNVTALNDRFKKSVGVLPIGFAPAESLRTPSTSSSSSKTLSQTAKARVWHAKDSKDSLHASSLSTKYSSLSPHGKKIYEQILVGLSAEKLVFLLSKGGVRQTAYAKEIESYLQNDSLPYVHFTFRHCNAAA
jgi:hypothetical protein